MKVPLLLDGAIESNLRQFGLRNDECVSEWILENQETVKSMYQNYAENGCKILCTPTAYSNSIRLKKFGLEKDTVKINERLCELVKPYCKNGIKMAGVVSTTNHIPEPFGDADFLNLFSIFSQQAETLKNSGADVLWVQAMTSLAEMRIAVLACKETGLPVYASVTLESDGCTSSGASPLSCLICVQALGVEAFGFEYCDCEIIIDTLKEIMPYAEVPIIARPDGGLENFNGNYDIPTVSFVENAVKCIEKGASLIGGGDGTSYEHIMALANNISENDIKAPEFERDYDECQIIAANASQAFFLSADSIEISRPLLCSQDMADELIEINSSSLDVITVEVHNYDDAFLFSQNANFVSLPVMFTTSNRLALESAIMFYDGKALIDSNCDIEPEVLKYIEKKYGAVIY